MDEDDSPFSTDVITRSKLVDFRTNSNRCVIVVSEAPRERTLFYKARSIGKVLPFSVYTPWIYHVMYGTKKKDCDGSENSHYHWTYYYTTFAPKELKSLKEPIYWPHLLNMSGANPCTQHDGVLVGSGPDMVSSIVEGYWGSTFNYDYGAPSRSSKACAAILKKSREYCREDYYRLTESGVKTLRERFPETTGFTPDGEKECSNLAFLLAWEQMDPEVVSGENVITGSSQQLTIQTAVNGWIKPT